MERKGSNFAKKDLVEQFESSTNSTHSKRRLNGYQKSIDLLIEKFYCKDLSNKDQAFQKQSTKEISTNTNESESRKTTSGRRSSPRSSGRKRKITEVESEKGKNVPECDATYRKKKVSSSEESVLPQSNKALTTERELSEEDTESDDEKTHVPYFDILKNSLKLPGWNKTTR
jgi:hypothetical protein